MFPAEVWLDRQKGGETVVNLYPTAEAAANARGKEIARGDHVRRRSEDRGR